jgi:hypothetical protein
MGINGLFEVLNASNKYYLFEALTQYLNNLLVFSSFYFDFIFLGTLISSECEMNNCSTRNSGVVNINECRVRVRPVSRRGRPDLSSPVSLVFFKVKFVVSRII